MGLKQARLIYNPIPEYFFKEPKPLPDKKRFLCASISGHNERLYDLAKEAAKEAGVELNVVSSKPRHEMPAVYDAHTALVLPTAYAQGYDLTVAEALARHRHVIATATGSYLQEARIRGAGSVGIHLVELGDKAALIEAMNSGACHSTFSTARDHISSRHIDCWLGAVS
jgi:hypothetical protein